MRLPITFVTRGLSVVASIALAGGILAGLTTSSSAAEATTINPATLPRGADVQVPYLDGKTIVDGDVRVTVKAPTVRLLGKSGAFYVVGVANRMGAKGRIVRIAADGTATRVARANIYLTELSGDGLTVVSTRSTHDSQRTRVRVRTVATGEIVASREFRGYVSALDAEADRVLLGRTTYTTAGTGRSRHKTMVWTTTTDSVAKVARLAGYEGDLSSDIFAGYTKDPYDGGCTVVAKVSTGERLWKSCEERVEAFAPDASRMATVDILSDGVGPSRVVVRSATGKRLATYDVQRGGWFGQIQFETSTALLLETNGRRWAATVRCTDAGCERASRLSPAEPVRR